MGEGLLRTGPDAGHDRLDAQAARLVQEMAQTGAPGYPGTDAGEVRAWYRGLSRWVAPAVPVDAVHDWPDGPAACPLRIYRTREHGWGVPRPLLVYLHSGGWVVGSLAASDERCRRLAAVTGCVVASVDYRLAPEHPYPTPLDDCWSALVELAHRAAGIGADPDRLVLVGDSSGGNLAAALTLRARDRGDVDVAHQVLLYPVVAADRSSFASVARYGQGFPLSGAELDWFTAQYLGSRSPDAQTAPLSAPDLAGLPSALVLTAECDLLRDEGEAYAARLLSAGVPTELHRLPGTVHGFFACSGALDAAHHATQLIARSLTARFGAGAAASTDPAETRTGR